MRSQKIASKKKEICCSHLWGHPEYGAGGLLGLLASRWPTGLDGRQTKVPDLHREVVVMEEDVVGLEVPEEEDIFSNSDFWLFWQNTCGWYSWRGGSPSPVTFAAQSRSHWEAQISPRSRANATKEVKEREWRKKNQKRKEDGLGEHLVEAGTLTPLGDNRQLPFLGDATHEEEDVDVPASANISRANIASANIPSVNIASANIARRFHQWGKASVKLDQLQPLCDISDCHSKIQQTLKIQCRKYLNWNPPKPLDLHFRVVYLCLGRCTGLESCIRRSIIYYDILYIP